MKDHKKAKRFLADKYRNYVENLGEKHPITTSISNVLINSCRTKSAD